ncbi:sulfotransferase [Rhodobacterales bacterium HKCCE2091]|nr:sulfotransferase [Rhodobacterales bacterium HKCCE2091]
MFPGIDDLRHYPELDDKTLLVCVGAMKCGTSWLHEYLGGLPEVAVSPLKELHFFNPKFPANELGDIEALALRRLAFHIAQEGDAAANLRRRPEFRASVDRARMIYDDDAYFGHFAGLVSPGTRVFCDITPAYSVLGPEGFAYLRAFCASQDITLKLLFVMRDPIERLWSQLRYMEQTAPDAGILSDWGRALSSPRICARADYRGTVTDLDATFPAEDVLYLFHETLFDRATLDRLCAFAGIAPGPADTARVVNETGLKRPIPDDIRAAAARLLAPQYAFCRDRFGAEIPAAWQG